MNRPAPSPDPALLRIRAVAIDYLVGRVEAGEALARIVEQLEAAGLPLIAEVASTANDDDHPGR